MQKLAVAMGTAISNVVMATAYHGSEQPQLQGSLSATEFGLYYAVPIVLLSTLLYPFVQQKLVARYAGESVVKPDPDDLRKYAVLLVLGIAVLIAVIAPMLGTAHLPQTWYAGGLGVLAVIAVFVHRDWLQARIEL